MLGFRFFLKEPAGVYPLVRELEYKHYYVLDNVQPATAWQAGYGNVFEWPTGVVLGRLNAFKPSDLGVVVRLGKAAPSVDENVAPAVFYQSSTPARVTGYLFTFSVRDDGGRHRQGLPRRARNGSVQPANRPSAGWPSVRGEMGLSPMARCPKGHIEWSSLVTSSRTISRSSKPSGSIISLILLDR